ncbi:MAG TPA: GNAT family N-acetyltransferase [Candidatus Saccharimonadales bacterium]|nr:GNAT family N-acetyltransferase [Candidatus Saccharimonadales bacterium]
MDVAVYSGGDYDGVVALYKNKAAYGGNFDPHRDTPERLMATSDDGNLYVARESGVVIGTFMILDNPHSFWLLRFAVDPVLPAAQGAAAALLARAQQIAAERGHDSIIVYTDSEDETLNSRYADLGFHKAANYRCYWKETKA